MVPAIPAGGETRWDRWSPAALVAILVALHGVAVWVGLEGWQGLRSDWPILGADHGIHYSHALTSQAMLRTTGFTAGYDPNYMAGFPMSVLAGTSFTLVNLTMALGAVLGIPPAPVYKATVGLAVLAAPLLVAWGSLLLGLGRRGMAAATLFYLLCVWSDFPISYVGIGMVAYFVAIPTGLVGLGFVVRFLERGGWLGWLGAALGLAATWLAHLTTPLVVGPAGLLAYLVAIGASRRGQQAFPLRRHVGFWLLGPTVLALNAFWWLPGVWLRSTLGATGKWFAHPESVLGRLAQIFWSASVIESVLLGLGVFGLGLLRAARPVAAGALGGLIGAGLAWGYLAGWFRALDGLQPGRHTYALFVGLCPVAALTLVAGLDGIRQARPGRWDRWATLVLALLFTRFFGGSVVVWVNFLLRTPPTFLASEPPPDLVRLVATLRTHVQPGERLLFEETGEASAGEANPFGGQHFSPVLPERTGVEVIGGPYLDTPLQTNFTQFGGGQLFGETDWGVDHFRRYAQLYRPAAIACWSRKARAFCRNHPDLIQIVDETGTLTVGRVVGYEGFTIRGRARVETGPNRLVVRDLVPDPSDGRVVLRYHWVPGLVADPPVPLDPIRLEADPVPFLALRPREATAGPITIRMAFP